MSVSISGCFIRISLEWGMMRSPFLHVVNPLGMFIFGCVWKWGIHPKYIQIRHLMGETWSFDPEMMATTFPKFPKPILMVSENLDIEAMTYWCLVGNFREWSTRTINFIIPFPHSHPFPTFSTSKMKWNASSKSPSRPVGCTALVGKVTTWLSDAMKLPHLGTCSYGPKYQL